MTWITPTFSGGWQNESPEAGQPAESACAYRVVGDYVELKGFVTDTLWVGGMIFTLPLGCRPDTVRRFSVRSSVGASQVRILPDGSVIAGDKSDVQLDGIRFSLT